MKRQSILLEINRYLAFLKSQVDISNTLNLTDINKHSEDFYRDLLNLVHGYNLMNINTLERNAAAIDLGDKEKRIAIQVTSTSSLTKIKKTYETFARKELYKDYDRLIILNINGKIRHRTQKLTDKNCFDFIFSEDLWDIASLIESIGQKDIKDMESVLAFLKENIRLAAKATISNEVETFTRLIELLSDDTQPLAGMGYKEEPDPEGKIDHRFAEHASFLKQQYTELFTEYGAVLTEVLEKADLGQPKIRRLGLYLKNISDDILSQKAGDAKAALDALVTHCASVLSSGSTQFDNSSIRFFLVDQLIRCNVFPNKEAAHG